jgi:hypothetical protein
LVERLGAGAYDSPAMLHPAMASVAVLLSRLLLASGVLVILVAYLRRR